MTSDFKKRWMPVFALIGIGFFIYAFNFNNQLFWDDDDWIVNNRYIHDFSHFKEIFSSDILAGFGLTSNYYRPLLLVSFAINYAIGGTNPLGYHIISNFIHILNAVLIFLLLRNIFRKIPPAFIASLLYLIHPLQIEAVTYISGRGDPMSVMFILGSLHLFIKSQNLRRGGKYLAGSLGCMVLAILTRETAVLMPAIIGIYLIAFMRKGSLIFSIKRMLIKLIPYLSISAVYVVLRLTVLNFNNTLNFYSEANAYTEHLSYRIYTFGAVLIEYFKLIFVPVGLHMERSFNVRTSLFQWPVWLSALIVIGIIYIGWVFYNKQKRIKGVIVGSDNFNVWIFSWLWFFTALGPVSGIIPINALIYEHWLYLPLVGFFTLAGFYIGKLYEFFISTKNRAGQIVLITILIIYCSFFLFQSIQRNILWGNIIGFYENTLSYTPDSIRLLNNLGNLYSENGNIDKSEEYYLRATKISEKFAQPFYNLGNIYRDRNQPSKAIEYYQKAIEVDPTFPFTYQNLALIYISAGEAKMAIDTLEKMKITIPNDPGIYYNLGVLYVSQKNAELAVTNLKKGLELSGGDVTMADRIKSLLSQIQNK